MVQTVIPNVTNHNNLINRQTIKRKWLQCDDPKNNRDLSTETDRQNGIPEPEIGWNIMRLYWGKVIQNAIALRKLYHEVEIADQ
jgi:hypothetical protein